MLFTDWYGLLRVVVSSLCGYAALIVILRSSGKRTLSKMNAFDLVVTVAIGSTFATLILSKDVAILEGVLAFASLVALQFGVAWASVRSQAFANAIKSQPTLLFYRGAFLHEALTRERFTEQEVYAAVRQTGTASLDDVQAVVLETAGDLSIIKNFGDATALCDVAKPERP